MKKIICNLLAFLLVIVDKNNIVNSLMSECGWKKSSRFLKTRQNPDKEGKYFG